MMTPHNKVMESEVVGVLSEVEEAEVEGVEVVDSTVKNNFAY